jgi:hypothetical protein
MVKPGQSVTSISYPEQSGVGHDWAYLPDAGEAFARRMDRDADLETENAAPSLVRILHCHGQFPPPLQRSRAHTRI